MADRRKIGRKKNCLMIFANRQHAGEVLARRLLKSKFDPGKSIVVAIPRGGIVVGQEIASLLKLSLFPLVIKKLGAPNNSELAIGATASFGKPVLDRWLIAELRVSGDYIKKEILKKKREARARGKFLGVKLEPEVFASKTVIVVDDGLGTGQTAKMAAKILKQFGARRLILAVGCAPTSVAGEVKKDYDEVVCPATREDFMAVGQFYRDFRPVEDEEVRE